MKEAEHTGRKAKHIAHFKGPVIITKHLSPTTFAINVEGRTYGRCLSELRKYNSNELPQLIDRSGEDDNRLAIVSYVSLCDTDDTDSKSYNLCHIAKVMNITDGQVQLLNYATTDKKISTVT